MINHLNISSILETAFSAASTDRRIVARHSAGKNAAGITLLEVIFATAVILIGLVGLAAILPLAGRRAQDALDFDAGSAVAVMSSQDIQAKKLIASGNLVPALQSGTVVSPFCLDPLFTVSAPINTASYNSSFFPFYSTEHDPLLDPADLTSVGATGLFAAQPRMLRAGLNFSNPVYDPSTDQNGDSNVDATDAAIAQARRFSVASSIAESPTDMNQLAAKDKTIAPALQSLTAVVGGFFAGTTVPSGQYTWFATVDPEEDSTTATLSVVVLRSRERSPIYPTTIPSEPSGNAIAERIALVSPLYIDSSGGGTAPASVASPTGFRGGAGGLVTLLSAGNTPSRLTSNDWVMLSRVLDNTDATTRVTTAVHRWYRVISSPGDVIELTAASDTTFDVPTDANDITVPSPPTGVTRTSAGQIWAQTVLLDGSDWGFATDVGSTKSNTLTFATIVRDVVAVHTTTISLTDF